MKLGRLYLLLLLTVVFSINLGCTHRQLRYDHVMQARSLTTIYEQQVLDNLAMFARSQSALPFFAIPGTGTANVNDNGSIAASTLNGPLRTVIGPLGISRGNSQTWTMVPVTDSAKLERMQLLYQTAISSGIASESPGGRRANAECALKGNYCGSHIQICEINRAAFTRLVLDVLNTALNDPPAATPQATVAIQDYIYNEDSTVKEVRRYNVNSSSVGLDSIAVGSAASTASASSNNASSDSGSTGSSGSSRRTASPSEAVPLSIEKSKVNDVIIEQQRQILRGSLFPGL